MFNIAIEQLPGKYVFVSHNNPTINTMDIVAETLSKFRFEKNIDPAVFVSALHRNIDRRDSKKNPMFYLGIDTILGENSSTISVVSFPQNRIGHFHENGTVISNQHFYDIFSVGEFFHQGGRFEMPRVGLIRAEKAPDKFVFPNATPHRLM